MNDIEETKSNRVAEKFDSSKIKDGQTYYKGEISDPVSEDSSVEEEEDINFKTDFSVEKKGAIYAIAKHLIEKKHVKTIGGRKVREAFVYEDGVYVTGEDILKKEIQEILEELCTTHYCKEIIEIIKNLTIRDRSDFCVNKKLINLNNGTLNIETKELLPHNPDNLFFTKIPVDYAEDANCPQIKKFLLEILEKDAVPVIQQWFGYCLYRSYFIKKAIIFVGEGDTGKTTLLKLFERFIGKDNVSGVSLQKMAFDKFAAANLYTKHLNSYDDLPFKDVSDNGAFKIATGGGSITGEYKFGDQFQFENFAKLTYTCNKIPDVKDTNDPAYYGRWIIIHFRNEVSNPDKFLIDKLTTSEEFSGLLNFALEGLKFLFENQKFSYYKEPHEIRSEMVLSGSVVAKFAQSCLSEATGKWISKDGMYEAFVSYARSEKLPADTKENLGRKIRNYADYIIDSKGLQTNPLTNNKVQERGWRHVEVKVKSAGSTDDIVSLEPSEDELNAVLNDKYQQGAEQQSLIL